MVDCLNEHNCLPVPFPMNDICSPPKNSKKLDMSMLKRHQPWWVVYGNNPVADCQKCQRRTIYPENETQWWYNYTTLVSAGKDKYINWTLHTPISHMTEAMESWKWPWTAGGLNFVEEWWLVDDAQTYLQIYYCTTLLNQPGYVLEGGLVLSEEPHVPAEALPTIRAKYSSMGVDFNNYCTVDNSCKPPAPAPAPPAPEEVRTNDDPNAKPNLLDFALFWTSDYRETDEVELPVDGTVPDWLDGTLYRNGPGRFEVGDRRVTHQFDGLAKIYKFRFSRGKVHYATKFLKSAQYNMSIEKNDFIKGMNMYPYVPPQSYPDRMEALKNGKNDNALINVWKTGDHLFVTQDGGATSMIDPVNLDYRGYGPPIKDLDYTKLMNSAAPAHPVRRVGGEGTINFLASTVVKPTGFAQNAVIYEDSPDMSRRIIGTVELPYMTTTHSFPMSENYVIFIAMPLEIHPEDLIDGKVESAVGTMRWRGDKMTTMYVFDVRKTNAPPVGIFETEPFFFNHQVNAYESQGPNGTVINIDLLGYKDSSFLTKRETFGSLDLMRDMHRLETWLKTDAPESDLLRIKIDLNGKRAAVQKRVVKDSATGDNMVCEMPRINDAFFGKPYCLYYAGCLGQAGIARGEYLQPTKINVCTGEATFMSHEPALFPDEGVFIPDGRGDEDAGLLAVPRLDAANGKTVLTLLDAQTFKEVARAHAPFHHASGVHGRFFPSARSEAVLV
jgi:carotenoid cleavage dioxygenase-like enzyme